METWAAPHRTVWVSEKHVNERPKKAEFQYHFLSQQRLEDLDQVQWSRKLQQWWQMTHLCKEGVRTTKKTQCEEHTCKIYIEWTNILFAFGNGQRIWGCLPLKCLVLLAIVVKEKSNQVEFVLQKTTLGNSNHLSGPCNWQKMFCFSFRNMIVRTLQKVDRCYPNLEEWNWLTRRVSSS